MSILIVSVPVPASGEGAAVDVSSLVVDRDDESPSNGDVAQMVSPAAGDVFVLYVGRQGSEDVKTTGAPAADVFIAPPPPPFVPSPEQSGLDQGNVFVDQPEAGPVVPSGQVVPSATDHYPADQSNVGPGLPTNMFT